MRKPEYNIYPSLLDAYTIYVRSDEVWDKYWGLSENPPHTPEEFREKQFFSLIDRINRVPIPWEDSEPADRGTALNEVVDCMVEGRNTERMEIRKVMEKVQVSKESWRQTNKVAALEVLYNKRAFKFDINLVRQLGEYFRGAVCQMRMEAELPTCFGPVILYGFADYVMPFSIHDLKSTGSYSVGKFRHNAQHLVYPYILTSNGGTANVFEYNVAELGKYGKWATYTETYTYDPERDIPTLTRMVEDFIRFINDNRNIITDKKIFNG